MTLLFALLALFTIPASTSAQAVYAENRKPAGNVEIEYTLTVTDPVSHLYDVRMAVRGIRSDAVDVAMPAWSPGVYFILDHVKNVQRFSAQSARGDALKWDRIDKQTWRIHKQTGDDVRIAYQVYSTDLTDEMADLSGPAVFMYVVGQKHAPVSVKFEIPSRWRVFTGLERRGDHFHAGDYDVFVDAPAFLGDFKVLEFESDKRVRHRIVFSNARLEITEDQVTADLKDLVDAASHILGPFPYKEYTFLVKITNTPAIAVVEHLNSSRIAAGSEDFVNQGGYRRFLNNAAHALVHVWNGKHIRPAAFAPLDYSKETYTKLLWFFEGVTNYYAGLLQLRAGLMTPPEFLGRMSLVVDTLQHQPGRRSMSLEDASWNAWLRGDNSANNAVSYSIKGEASAFLFDAEIRGRTQNAKSLDDVMRRLISDYADPGIGVPEDGVLRAIESAAGSAFGEFYDRVVRSKDELDYNRVLGQAGLRTEVFKQPSTIYFGFEFERAENNQVRLRRIAPNSPAQRAQLDAGDILIAMDSERVTFDNLTSRIHSKRIGRPVVLTLLRGERLLTLNLTPADFQDEQWSVVEIPNAAAEQVRIRTEWLGMSQEGR